MNYRTATILAATDLTTAGTKTIDVNIADVISRISLIWKPVKSKHGMDSYCHKDITKIELVDGSEVLHGLNGGQNQALCIYDRKAPTMNLGEHVSGVADISIYGIDFGRYLFDPVLAFDPKRFRNPQLKVTWDEDVADTGVTVNTLEVKAECFDEKVVTPMGMLTAKEHYNYTPAASGSYEYIDLPTDRLLRKMLIQGYRSAYNPEAQISEAKLDEDNEKRIPFDWVLEDYLAVMKGVWRAIEETFYGYTQPTTGRDFYITPTDYHSCIIALPQSVASLGYTQISYGGKVTLASEANPEVVLGMARGYLPNHCFEFPFGDQMDMADWYDITKLGSLRLRLKAGGSGTSGNGAVVLQQLRKY